MKNWKNLGRRGLSLLVCLMMCLSMLPGTALAAWGDSCTKGGKHAYELFNGKTPQGSVVAYTYCTKCYAIVDALGNWGEPGQYCSSYADHRYTYTPNGDANCQSKGTKTGTCDCGATIIVAGDSYGSHSYIYTHNGDGTHTGVCSNNSAHTTGPESCTYGNDGKCTACGAEQEKPCEHTNTRCEANGTTHHDVVCIDCNAKVEENVECTFTTPEATSCVDETITVDCDDECGNKKDLTVKGKGHSYKEPYWTWTADHSSATAQFDCANCTDSQTVTDNTPTKDGAPTCGAGAEITYTAKVTFDGKEHTDSVTETVGATGEHSYTGGKYRQDANKHYALCDNCGYEKVGQKHTFPMNSGICSVCGYVCPHTDKAPILDTAKDATCTEAGKEADTMCTSCGKHFDGKPIPALDHRYGEPTWTWTVTDPSATATFTCANNQEHKHEIVARGTSIVASVTKAPDCGSKGEKTYTATILFEGQTYTNTHKTDIPATGEHAYTSKVTKAASCSETGVTTFTCTKCGAEYTESIPVDPAKHPKTEVKTTHTDATCELPETTVSKCDMCGIVISTVVGQLRLGHDYTSEVTKEATCTEDGIRTYTCQRKGCTEDTPNHSYTETISARHNTFWVPEVPATCVSKGMKGHSKCTECGQLFVSGTDLTPVKEADLITPMVPHTLTKYEEIPATCTEAGKAAYSHCSVCGKDFTGSGTGLTEVSEADLVIPVTDHTPVTDPAVEATCTSTGLTEGSHCSVCNAVLVAQEVTPVTDHTPVIDPAVEATCTSTGLTAGSHCEVCNAVLVAQETVAMLPHTEVIDPAVAPTCTSTGLTEGSHCSVCGTTIVARTEIAANGHTEAIDAAVAPTCEETGLTAGSHCTVCGAVLTAQEAIPALGHSWDEGVVTRRPTPTVAGEMTYTCTVCGATRTEPIPATNIELPEPDPDTDGGGTGGGAGGGTAPTPNPGGNVEIIDDDVPLADIIFDDVLPTDPFYEAVKYVYERGLMNGVSDTSFDPHGTLNRAMVVTILYRLEGEPTAEPSSFKDVEAGKWYTDAIGWGAANEIVEGYDADRFGPMDPVTREQLAAILYRYAQYKEYDVAAKADLTSYADASSIHEYAVEAMSWAVELGAPAPLDDGTLAPRVNATRAQVAVAFMNFCEKYVPLPAEGEAA